MPGKLGDLLRTLLVMLDIDSKDGLPWAREAVEQEIFELLVSHGYNVSTARMVATALREAIEVKKP